MRDQVGQLTQVITEKDRMIKEQIDEFQSMFLRGRAPEAQASGPVLEVLRKLVVTVDSMSFRPIKFKANRQNRAANNNMSVIISGKPSSPVNNQKKRNSLNSPTTLEEEEIALKEAAISIMETEAESTNEDSVDGADMDRTIIEFDVLGNGADWKGLP